MSNNTSCQSKKLVYEITVDRNKASYVLEKIRWDVDLIEFVREFDGSHTSIKEVKEDS